MSYVKITSTPANSDPQVSISSTTVGNSTTMSAIPFPGKRGETGPQGEQGIQGIQGIQGEKGDSGGFYEHNQSAVSTVWYVTHNLGYNPNVTVMDSASTIIEAELWYNDTNSLEIRFSHGISGKAYLS